MTAVSVVFTVKLKLRTQSLKQQLDVKAGPSSKAFEVKEFREILQGSQRNQQVGDAESHQRESPEILLASVKTGSYDLLVTL